MDETQRGVQRTAVKAAIRAGIPFLYKMIMDWEGLYYGGIHTGYLWSVGGASV